MTNLLLRIKYLVEHNNRSQVHTSTTTNEL